MSKRTKMQQGQQDKKYRQLCDNLARIASTLSGEDQKTVEEAADIIYDYTGAVEMTARLVNQYETAAEPTRRGGGIFYCPSCCRRISANNEHCHWCGKLLEW